MPKRSVSSRNTWPKTSEAPCRVCNNLDTKGSSATSYDGESSSKIDVSLSIAIDLVRLKRSREWCRFCRVTSQVLYAFQPQWSTVRKPLLVEIRRGAAIRMSLETEALKNACLEIYIPTGTRSPWPGLGVGRNIPGSAGAENTFEFARRCIAHCMAKHQTCQEAFEEPPCRLIFLGKYDSQLKLCFVSGRPSRYAALSHCWGSGPSCSTTKANFRSRMKSFANITLPPLFQDAVHIARQLGLEYLWIDALCIIQDSHEDWTKESANMMYIYRHATITLSAVACKDSADRILVEREQPVKLTYENTAGKNTVLKARKVGAHHPERQQRDPMRPHGPLMSRSWAFQEHLLGSRILHFTSTEVVFECRSSFRCECSPDPIKCSTNPGLLYKIPKSRLWSAWHEIVSQYTLRDLTFPKDKLPAISGVALHFQQYLGTKTQYLAGIWKANLPFDLLWSSSATLKSPVYVPRLVDYRAPTFSWASTDTSVLYHDLFVDDGDPSEAIKSLVYILDAQCSTAPAYPLGAVTAGFIHLEGQVAEGTLTAPSEYTFAYHLRLSNSNSSVEVAPDTLLVARDAHVDGKLERTVSRGRQKDEYASFSAKVWCLSVTSSLSDGITGFVLGPSAHIPGAMERLGMFSCGHEWFAGAGTKDIRLV